MVPLQGVPVRGRRLFSMQCGAEEELCWQVQRLAVIK